MYHAISRGVRREGKDDPGKLARAERLKKETTLSIKDIAGRAQLGSSRSANAWLHRWLHDRAATDGTMGNE